MGRMTDWKRERYWLEQETGPVYTLWRIQAPHGKQLKQRLGEKIN